MKTENRLPMWKCSQCDKEFKYESEKRRHEQSHVPQFQCKVCTKKFSFLSALRRHEKQHERKASVKCNECERKFRDETLLKRHVQYAHKGTYTCTRCKSTYHSDIALHTHMKTHKPQSEWKFQCSFNGCTKRFNFPHHLKHHELTHTNTRPHVCKDCGKRFIQLHHLKVHQRLHKPDSWLYCTELDCEKRFTNEYALRRHIATHNKKSSSNRAKANINPLCKVKDEGSTPNYSCEAQAQDGAISIITCSQKGRFLTVKPVLLNDVHHSLNALEVDNVNIAEDFTGSLADDIDNVYCDKVLDNQTYKTDNNLVINIDEANIKLLEAGETENEYRIVSNCQSVLGKCIITGKSDVNENCLCGQMEASEPIDKILTFSVPINTNCSVKLSDDPTCIAKRRKYANACDTCECASICDLKNIAVKNELPEIVYRNDGVVKIKDTFDIDFAVQNSVNQKAYEAKFDLNMKYVAISSCKDVLGNCIVSGNGTMGEECLCARMTAEDQQIIEQEMDEITPHPWSS